MKKTMKRTAALLLALVLVFASACSSSTTQTDAATQAAETEGTEAAGETGGTYTPGTYTGAAEGFSGATISSDAIVEAVKDALTQAGATEFAQAQEQTYSRDDIAFTAGTYQATEMGMNGEIEIEVTFSENTIDDITVLSSLETTGGRKCEGSGILPGGIRYLWR